MKKNQTIKCEVESCKFQDIKNSNCNLEAIEVGCECDNNKAKETCSTICKSFECDLNKLKK